MIIQKPKGTIDYFGKQSDWFNFVNQTLKGLADIFRFQYIETPIFESANVFTSSIGNENEIITKEMYHFQDRKQRALSLRPEGTAGTIRAVTENKLWQKNDYLKLYYQGAMFRYERPQKGRHRQFNQFGVEVIGPVNVVIDVEVLSFAKTILQTLRIDNTVLEINFLGGTKTQTTYKKALRNFFTRHQEKLSKESQERLQKNVLRILDSKNELDKKLFKIAPKISQFYDKQEKIYWENLISILKLFEIEYQVNPYLVRGIDYYTDLIFEFVSQTSQSGAQNTLIGGGRYAHLMKQAGGQNTSGIGFALGIERIINEIQHLYKTEEISQELMVYVGCIDAKTLWSAQMITYSLRLSGISAEASTEDCKLSKLFKTVDKKKPRYLIVLGPKEIATSQVTIKNQLNGKEEKVKIAEIVNWFQSK